MSEGRHGAVRKGANAWQELSRLLMDRATREVMSLTSAASQRNTLKSLKRSAAAVNLSPSSALATVPVPVPEPVPGPGPANSQHSYSISVSVSPNDSESHLNPAAGCR